MDGSSFEKTKTETFPMPRNFRPRLRPVASLLALGLVLASCGGGGNGNPALWLAPPPTGAGSPDSAPPPPPPAAVGQALSISTHEIASKAKALRTPGTTGVKVDASSKLARISAARGGPEPCALHALRPRGNQASRSTRC